MPARRKAPTPEPVPAHDTISDSYELGARIYYAGPEWQLVPSTLADFECAHGVIGPCDACTNARLVMEGR